MFIGVAGSHNPILILFIISLNTCNFCVLTYCLNGVLILWGDLLILTVLY